MDDTDFTWSEVGSRIRDWRVAKQMTLQELSEIAGITPAGLFRIEAGTTNPQLQTLHRVGNALGRSVREMISGSDLPRDEHMSRVARIFESGDDQAVDVLLNGLRAAELLVERRAQPIRSNSRLRAIMKEGGYEEALGDQPPANKKGLAPVRANQLPVEAPDPRGAPLVQNVHIKT